MLVKGATERTVIFFGYGYITTTHASSRAIWAIKCAHGYVIHLYYYNYCYCWHHIIITIIKIITITTIIMIMITIRIIRIIRAIRMIRMIRIRIIKIITIIIIIIIRWSVLRGMVKISYYHTTTNYEMRKSKQNSEHESHNVLLIFAKVQLLIKTLQAHILIIYDDVYEMRAYSFRSADVYMPAGKMVSLTYQFAQIPWWRHQLETFSALLAFVRGSHRSRVNSLHKGQLREALMFLLVRAWINGWVNNREPDDLRNYRAHYDVTVMMDWVIDLSPYKPEDLGINMSIS